MTLCFVSVQIVKTPSQINQWYYWNLEKKNWKQEEKDILQEESLKILNNL